MRVKQRQLGRAAGRLRIRADEESLTPYAGLAIVGTLVERLGLVELIERELAAVRRARPIKQRRRGLCAGELLLALAESQLAGGECFDDLESLRADRAGACLRTVAAVPAAPTARQRARRFRRSHAQAIERALARAGERLDRRLGRDVSAPVTIDLDATTVEVYGAGKQGARRNRFGQRALQPHVAVWAERGRPLASELLPGNANMTGPETARLARRTLALLPAGHGPVSFRVDSGFYRLELLQTLQAAGARFSVSLRRVPAAWAALERIPERAWRPALAFDGAEVAETSYSPIEWQGEPLRLLVRRVPLAAAELARDPRARRRRTIPPQQLQLALSGELDSVHGYSFILTDHQGEPAEIELHHRQRAQIEERLKEAKLGQALRRLPAADLNANRLWLQATLTALTLSAFLCDLCPAAAASGQAPAGTPKRRAAKTLRRLLLCVPARIVRTARTTTLRLPAGFRHAAIFQATYAAAWALPP